MREAGRRFWRSRVSRCHDEKRWLESAQGRVTTERRYKPGYKSSEGEEDGIIDVHVRAGGLYTLPP
jgi:hypothetical protein